MTADQFRGSGAWKRARKLALSRANGCAICGGAFVVGLGRHHPLSATIDHLVPLARIDLGTAAGRALAVDQAFLRAVHLRCNSRRGQAEGMRRRRAPASSSAPKMAAPVTPLRTSRDW